MTPSPLVSAFCITYQYSLYADLGNSVQTSYEHHPLPCIHFSAQRGQSKNCHSISGEQRRQLIHFKGTLSGTFPRGPRYQNASFPPPFPPSRPEIYSIALCVHSFPFRRGTVMAVSLLAKTKQTSTVSQCNGAFYRFDFFPSSIQMYYVSSLERICGGSHD